MSDSDQVGPPWPRAGSCQRNSKPLTSERSDTMRLPSPGHRPITRSPAARDSSGVTVMIGRHPHLSRKACQSAPRGAPHWRKGGRPPDRAPDRSPGPGPAAAGGDRPQCVRPPAPVRCATGTQKRHLHTGTPHAKQMPPPTGMSVVLTKLSAIEQEVMGCPWPLHPAREARSTKKKRCRASLREAGTALRFGLRPVLEWRHSAPYRPRSL